METARSEVGKNPTKLPFADNELQLHAAAKTWTETWRECAWEAKCFALFYNGTTGKVDNENCCHRAKLPIKRHRFRSSFACPFNYATGTTWVVSANSKRHTKWMEKRFEIAESGNTVEQTQWKSVHEKATSKQSNRRQHNGNNNTDTCTSSRYTSSRSKW